MLIKRKNRKTITHTRMAYGKRSASWIEAALATTNPSHTTRPDQPRLVGA